MALAIVGLYALFAFIAILNLLLMRRPKRSGHGPSICVLIPARNEEENLRRLLSDLFNQERGLRVYVYDDESQDDTASVARSLGATVLTPSEPLPAGWTGKNRACHELALAAGLSDSEWFLFLDADVRPEPGLLDSMRWLCLHVRPRVGLITGFPRILPGSGIEPLVLAWVGWILLVSNPYGLVARTGLGHNRFKNGQVHCWRREVYLRLRPNEQVRDRIMEDVMIGRLMAKEHEPIEVANLSSVLSIRMYESWRETLDGMSKNAYEITNSNVGTILIAGFMLLVGWAWLLAGRLAVIALALFVVSGVGVTLIVRTVIWPILFMPLIPTIGGFTILRSMVWHRRGAVHWKGRIYPGSRAALRGADDYSNRDKAGSTPAES